MRYLLFILLFIGLNARAQTVTKSGSNTQIQENLGSSKVDRMLIVPRTFNPFPSFDSTGAIWLDSANTKLLWYHNGITRVPILAGGGGNADSVTFFTNYRADTMRRNIYGNINSLNDDLGGAYGLIADLETNKMNYTDTFGLSNRIDLKQNFVDTNNWDATKAYVKNAVSTKMFYTDTIALSNRINAKQNFTDTSTYDATKANLNTGLALKVNYTDTVGTSNRINLKQNFTDTSTWDATKANIAVKMNYTDTVGMSNRINLRIPYPDTVQTGNIYSRYQIDTFKTRITSAASGGSPAGSNTQIQYNNSGAFGGAFKSTIASDGNLVIVASAGTPTAPAAGNVKLYSDSKTGIEELYISTGSDGFAPMQMNLGTKIWGEANPTNGAVVGTGSWQSFVGSTGTLANVTKSYDATNLQPNYSGIKATSTATTNAVAAFNVNSTQRGMMVGNAAFGGGAKYVATFAFPTYVSTERVFVGYYGSSASPPLVDPSTLVTVFGIGKDAADATLQLMYNDASGTCTKVNTGITPNVNDVYRVTIFIPPNSVNMYATVEDMTKTGISTYNSGAINTNLPPAGTILIAHCATGTAASSTAVTTLLIQLHEEQY